MDNNNLNSFSCVTEKDAARAIYHCFLEIKNEFKESIGFLVSDDVDYTEVCPIEKFAHMVERYMLDIPSEVYDGLMNFYRDILNKWYNITRPGDPVIFDTEEYSEYIVQFEEETKVAMAIFVAATAERAHEQIREILERYIPQ